MNERYTALETDKVAGMILEGITPFTDKATVIGLSGDLGAGKTTLVQALARALGVAQQITSPTFVIAKYYDAQHMYKTLIHIDAYRIESLDELAPLGWDDLLTQQETIIVVEWPERIESKLPEGTFRFHIAHNDTDRTISQL